MAKKSVKVIKRQNGQVLFESARWCSSFLCRLVGYQFRRRLKPGEALILVHGQDTVKASSIHMLFVFTPLTVIWVNREGLVTSVQLARPWRLHYASPKPASYVLETSPESFDRFQVGEELEFI
jgi:uncharacterized membrane protein (UPF0127 family)